MAVVFTYPVITNFTTHIPGIDEDSPTHVWYLWWFKFSVFDKHIDPFITDYVFYPQMVNRIFDIHTIPLAIMSLPFQYLLGTVPAANIVFLSGFVLSGLGSYLLTYYLTKSRLPSLFSGLIFAFTPYTFGQIIDNHTNLYTTWFQPFYLLFLLKTLKEKRWKNPAFAGIFFGLQALNDLTSTSFMIVLTGLVLAYKLFSEVSLQALLKGKLVLEGKEFLNPGSLKRLSLIALLFLIISFPITSRALSVNRREFGLKSPLVDQDYYSADPSFFWQPSAFHPILSNLSLAPYPKFSSIEGTLFIGFTVMILILIALLKYFKESKFFLFLAASYFILMLGPTPSWFGQDFKIPFPFYFYHVIPFIGGIKEPVRMDPFLMLPLAVVSGIVLSKFLEKLKEKGIFLFLFLSGLVLFEYYPGKIPTTDLTPPEIYHQIAKDKGDFTVLDLPVGWSTGGFGFGTFPIGSLQYYQSIHQKKEFRATIARLPAKNVEFYKGIPGLRYLADSSVGNQDDQNKELVRKTFKDLKIKYITVSDKYYKTGKGRGKLGSIQYLEQVVGAKKISDKDGVLAYLLE